MERFHWCSFVRTKVERNLSLIMSILFFLSRRYTGTGKLRDPVRRSPSFLWQPVQSVLFSWGFVWERFRLKYCCAIVIKHRSTIAATIPSDEESDFYRQTLRKNCQTANKTSILLQIRFGLQLHNCLELRIPENRKVQMLSDITQTKVNVFFCIILLQPLLARVASHIFTNLHKPFYRFGLLQHEQEGWKWTQSHTQRISYSN